MIIQEAVGSRELTTFSRLKHAQPSQYTCCEPVIVKILMKVKIFFMLLL